MLHRTKNHMRLVKGSQRCSNYLIIKNLLTRFDLQFSTAQSQQKKQQMPAINKSLNQKQQTQISLQQKFKEILERANFRQSSSVFISEEQLDVKKKRKLSKYEKQLLMINLPKNELFKPRMTLQQQLSYKQRICQQLYKWQDQSLVKTVRIMQDINQNKDSENNASIDGYFNLLYKDIYSRYLLSKGIGVEWQIDFKNPGSVTGYRHTIDNDTKKYQLEKQQIYQQLYLIFKYLPFHAQSAIGLFSVDQQIFIDSQRVEVENVKRIGYFNTIELTEFGKYQGDFQNVKERGGKVSLVFFTDYLEKLFNLQAICLQNGKMLILQNPTTIQYYITSVQVYLTHRNFFKNKGFQKKSGLPFQGTYLLGMKAQFYKYQNTESESGKVYAKSIPIIEQVQGYERKPGLYAVCGGVNMADFQRMTENGLKVQQTFFSKSGLVEYDRKTFDLRDPTFGPSLFQRIKHRKQQKLGITDQINVQFLQIHQFFEDQIYSEIQTHEPLHFRTLNEKIVIPIEKDQVNCQIKQRLLQIVEDKDFVTESKIQIPRPKVFHKPREKRRFERLAQQLLQQKTDYFTLKQGIQRINTIAISSLNQKQQSYVKQERKSIIMPILKRKNQFGLKQILPYSLCGKQIIQIIQQGIKGNSLPWNTQKQQQEFVNNIKQINSSFQVQFVTIRDRVIRSLLFFNQTLNYNQKKTRISSVIVQPQSSSEINLPNHLLIGMILQYVQERETREQQKQQGKQRKRGRSIKKDPQSSKSTKLIQAMQLPYSLIKLHPTISPSQRDMSIHQALYGVKKANKQYQYGFGFQALRLWLCKNDNFLGDRIIKDGAINSEIKFATFIRKLYWQLIPLISSQYLNNFNDKSLQSFYFKGSVKKPQNKGNQNEIQTNVNFVTQQGPNQICFLDKFILYHIDYYILNMQHYYTQMKLHQVYHLTHQFFKHYIDEIYLSTLRKDYIAFGNDKRHRNPHRQKVLAKIVSLLSVISPIIPFSSHHISRQQLMQWPSMPNAQHIQRILHETDLLNPQKIQYFNRFIKLRVEVRNKMMLNRFRHAWITVQIVIPIEQKKKNENYVQQFKQNYLSGLKGEQQLLKEQEQRKEQIRIQSLKRVQAQQNFEMAVQQLNQFFGVDTVSFIQPPVYTKKFKLRLKKGHPFEHQVILHVYDYDQSCIRCDQKSERVDLLCNKCTQYIQDNLQIN